MMGRMKLSRRKKQEKKLNAALVAHKDFLIERLQKEWEEMEGEERRELRRKELMEIAKTSGRVAAQTLLVLTALVGVAVVAVVAPNLFAAFGRMSGRRRYFRKDNFPRTVSYLKEKRLIESESRLDGYTLKITERGLIQAAREGWKNLRIKRAAQWDGHWRVIIFDIPDRKKWERDALRGRLRALGFYQLQKSVFAFPDPCEEEIKFLASFLNIGGYLRLLITKDLSHDGDLKKFFGITQ